VVAGVDLEIRGFDGEPNRAARPQRQVGHGRGCDVDQGGWLALQVEPDPVGQQRQAGDLGWPGIAGTAGPRWLAADDDGGGVGGADPARGSGLAGLAQRVRTGDGLLAIASPPGGPTQITVELPLRA
jgi:hypothetical protein